MFKYVLLTILSVFIVTFNPTVFAHQVKTTAQVGATLHIEPNDTPRSGEPTTVWFALTRKGGKVIPLAECNCQLAVYAEPYASGEPPLLEPTLESVSAERYQGIPGAKFTFPRPGTYQLHLRGESTAQASFKPFNLKFNVTVAAGKSVRENTQDLQDINQNIPNTQTRTALPWAIAGFGLITIGFLFFLVQRVNRNRDSS